MHRPECKKLWMIVLALCGLLIAGSDLYGQSGNQPPPPPLSLEIQQGALRTHAPMTLNVKLVWRKPSLLTGRLILEIDSGAGRLMTYTSDELNLTAGANEFSLTLPPIDVGAGMQMNASARFEGKDYSRRFPMAYSLTQQTQLERTLVIGELQPRVSMVVNDVLIRTLSLEQFQPPNSGPVRLRTRVNRLSARSLSISPMSLCSYDMLLIRGPALAELRGGQLEAIHRWLRAGGRLVMTLDQTPLEPHHQAFIEKIEDSPATGSGSDPAMRHVGLGRALIVRVPPANDGIASSESWRSATAFIWSARSDQINSMVQSGAWINQHKSQYTYDDTQGNVPRFDWQPLVGAGFLADWLLPSDMQIIPFWVVSLILIGFVLVIGPIDYFVLGMMKMRKMTWVIFPVVAVAFTVFTVFASEYYMGTSDHRSALIFVDLDEGGGVVRESRYELIFTAKHRTIVQEIEQDSYVSLSQDRLALNNYNYSNNYEDDLAASDIAYTGRYPTAYQTEQRFNQWSPQLNRQFRIDGLTSGPKINWTDLLTADLPEDDNAKQKLVSAVETAFDQPVDVLLIKPNEQTFLSESKIIQTRGGPESFGYHDYNASEYVQGLGIKSVEAFIRIATVRPQQGLFSIVSTIAPNGGPTFEDVALLDASDMNGYVIVIAVEDGEDVLLYRYRYTGEK